MFFLLGDPDEQLAANVNSTYIEAIKQVENMNVTATEAPEEPTYAPVQVITFLLM